MGSVGTSPSREMGGLQRVGTSRPPPSPGGTPRPHRVLACSPLSFPRVQHTVGGQQTVVRATFNPVALSETLESWWGSRAGASRDLGAE